MRVDFVKTGSFEGLNEIYKELVDEIGFENTQRVYKIFKGTQVSFPINLYSSDYIHNRIAMEFNGQNIKQLAKKYGYSERTIRRIINKNE